jgi:protein TonB
MATRFLGPLLLAGGVTAALFWVMTAMITVEVIEIDTTPPRYPERALARGIEGRVLVEFTIAASGNVRDAHVVAAEPSSIFNQSAVEAVSQWRYTPKIVDGNPVERRGMRISIPFRRGSDESI